MFLHAPALTHQSNPPVAGLLMLLLPGEDADGDFCSECVCALVGAYLPAFAAAGIKQTDATSFPIQVKAPNNASPSTGMVANQWCAAREAPE